MNTKFGLADMTRIDRSSQAGQYLRCHWFPVCFSHNVKLNEPHCVELLGEKLLVVRIETGQVGAVHEHCFHRGCSLRHGEIRENGITCPYHGLVTEFIVEGRAFNSHGKFRSKVLAKEVGGLIFVTLNEAHNSFVLFDIFNVDSQLRQIRWEILPCNWFQIMESAFDPMHLEWLHGRFPQALARRNGKLELMSRDVRSHKEIQFDEFELGFIKRRVVFEQDKTSEDWRVGQRIIMPNVLCLASPGYRELQFCTPISDKSTLHIWYRVVDEIESPNNSKNSDPVRSESFNDAGEFNLETIDGQDAMAWCSAGQIVNRDEEHLQWFDKGIEQFRARFAADVSRGRGDGIKKDDVSFVVPTRHETTSIVFKQ